MTKRIQRSTAALVLLIGSTLPFAPAAAVELFEEVEIIIEQNETDGDAELVVFAKGGDDGFKRMTVFDPNGARIIRFKGRDGGKLGMREFLLESPEPGIGPVLEAFPEGEYLLSARTFDGARFVGLAALSHDLAPGATGLSPADGETVNLGAPVVLSWNAVDGATSYTVEVENDDLEVGLLVNVPADVLSITVPSELLAPGVEYEFGIGTTIENGNTTFVEVAFETSP